MDGICIEKTMQSFADLGWNNVSIGYLSTVILLTHWKGRFGNRMFTYLYGVNYARRHSTQFFLPSKWEGTTLFTDCGVQVFPDESLCSQLIESGRNRTDPEVRHEAVRSYFESRGIPVSYHDPDKDEENQSENVYFEKLCVQSERIFQRYSMREVRSIFEWSPAVKESSLYQEMEARKGTYSVAHLRRGDIANVSLNERRDTAYSVLSRQSYERAFSDYGVSPEEVIWVTDDRTGNWGIPRNPVRQAGWSYPEGSTPIEGCFFDWLEDFFLIYFAKSVFRANSSFSWWAACLNPNAKIYSPVLTERKNYLGPGDELDVEFVEGNHPHWLNLKRGRPTDNIYIPA